jgi:type II secretory pathway pseudopilin PulG
MKWRRILQIAAPLCVIALLLWIATGSRGAARAHHGTGSGRIVASGSDKLVASQTHTHTSTTALIIGLIVLLLILVALFFLVRWIVRRVARLFRRRQATGLGSAYEQMITQQGRKSKAPKADQWPPAYWPPPPQKGWKSQAEQWERQRQWQPPPQQWQPPAQPQATTSAPTAPETKTCPDCAETVLAAARVCRYCHYRFDQPPDSSP